MRKVLIQGILSVLLFFGTWFALSQINWIDFFYIDVIFQIQKEEHIEIDEDASYDKYEIRNTYPFNPIINKL